jgi:hypothetical protein
MALSPEFGKVTIGDLLEPALFEVRARTFTLGLEDKYPPGKEVDGVSVLTINVTRDNMDLVKDAFLRGDKPTELDMWLAHWYEIESATKVTMDYTVMSRIRESTVKAKREIRRDLERMRHVGVNVIKDFIKREDGISGRIWMAELMVDFRDINVRKFCR